MPSQSQADLVQKPGVRGGVVKVAVHWLRKRFRELVEAEAAQTVPEPGDVLQELRSLVEVLAQPKPDPCQGHRT